MTTSNPTRVKVDHFGELQTAFSIDHIGDPALSFAQVTGKLILRTAVLFHDHSKGFWETLRFHAGRVSRVTNI
jgi:hypothetical protein